MKTLLHLSVLVLGLVLSTQTFGQCSGGAQYGYVGWYDDGSGGSDYNNSQSCSWTFTSAMGGTVRLGFYDFNTESGYDYVRIYDGYDSSAPLIVELSGNIEPSQYFTTGTVAYVEWTTDGSVTAPGFNAWWDSYVSVRDECVGYISDGDGDYPINTEAKWFIQPEGAESITLDLYFMDMEFEYDYIHVYDGYDESGILLGSFTGGAAPGILVANSGAMYIKMTSDEIIPLSGFNATYNCNTCSGTTNMTGSSGTITDGSGNGTHGNGADCSWYINPAGATSIEFDFEFMQLEGCCDYVTIHDGPNSSSPILATVTNEDTPQNIIVGGNQAFVHFVSDASVVFQGFTLNYTSGFVGVDEVEANYEFNAFPNPTRGLFTLEIGNAHLERFSLELYDYQGRKLSIPNQFQTIGGGQHAIDLSPYSTGIYYVKLTDEAGRVSTVQIQKLD
jgi:hypothetical protein